jgi:two-component system cell cycle response regulator
MGSEPGRAASVGAIIVLADDEPELRAIYATCLRADGHEVWEAADGLEAVALVAERRPSLLILDVWMPNLNGFEVLERLRHDPCAASLKVVMLSNLGDSDTRLEGFSVGVADYWLKGLSLADLRARVERLVADTQLAPDPS